METGSGGFSISPDGAWLGIQTVDGPARVPVSGGASQPVTRGADGIPHWSPDGRWIFFTRAGNVWRIASDGTGERQLTNLQGRRGFHNRFDADDRYIYFAWREDVSDIWVMDVDQGLRRSR